MLTVIEEIITSFCITFCSLQKTGIYATSFPSKVSRTPWQVTVTLCYRLRLYLNAYNLRLSSSFSN